MSTGSILEARVVAVAQARGLLDATRIGGVRAYATAGSLPFVEALRELRVVTDEDLLDILQESTGVEAIDPALVSADPSFTEAMERLWPHDLAQATRAIPIRYLGASLQVAMVEPWDLATRTAIEAFTGSAAVPALMLAPSPGASSRRAAEEMIAERWRDRERLSLEAHMHAAAERVNRRAVALVRSEDLARDPDVVLAVHAILCRAAAARASDVHVDPTSSTLRIRFRIDGRLREIVQASAVLRGPFLARLRLLGGQRDAGPGALLDAAFTVAVSPVRTIDVRMAVVPSLGGERCSLRLVDRAASIPAIADIGMEPSVQLEVEDAIGRPHGLILVSGPTGSGKSSTLLLDVAPPILAPQIAPWSRSRIPSSNGCGSGAGAVQRGRGARVLDRLAGLASSGS